MNDGRSVLAPLTGILFVIALIAGFVIGGEPPGADEDVQEIIDFYVDNETEVVIGSFLQALAAALFVCFVAYLRKVLRVAETEGGGASLLAFGGAIIFAVGACLDATINIALADAVEDIDPAAVQALSALWNNDFVPLAVGLFLFLLGTGISIVRHAVFPKWLGWAAIVLAIAGLTPAWFVPFIGGALLVVILSVTMAMRARSPRAA